MDLGYFATPYFPVVRRPRENAAALLDRARLAREAGYEYVQAADHHVTHDGQFFQNWATAGRLAAEFDHVAVLSLLPLSHPLVVAEQVGTLGAFTDHLDVWCAIGGNEAAFDALGVNMDRRVPRLLEGVELLEQLLEEDHVTFEGDVFDVEDVSVNPKATVRLCLGGLAEPAVRRAGRLGEAWVAHPTESLADLGRKLEWFDEADGGDVVVRRDALVLSDGDEAREVARGMLEDGYRGWPVDADWPLVGAPEEIATDLAALADRGVEEVVVGAMSHDHAEETIRGVARAREEI